MVNSLEINLGKDVSPNAMRFDGPTPGESWAEEEGKWGWDKPSEITDPADAVAYVIDQVEKDEASIDEIRKLMLSGISIEEIVNTAAFGGFTTGMWSPDVAELIKTPLTVYFIEFAGESKIPATVFSEATYKRHTEPQGMTEDEMFTLMRENRPDLYEAAGQGLEEERKDIEAKISQGELEEAGQFEGFGFGEERVEEPVKKQSFIDMEA
jgi:hypothetical protein